LKFTASKTIMYTMLIVDLSEAYCAHVYSDGEIKRIFELRSEVPNKHKKGGQSAARFARQRENEITQWFKLINETLKPIKTELYVSITFVYRKRFHNHLTTYNKEKIKQYDRHEYSGITGVYQYISLLEENK
jgi:peptide subunit release factor 1 (eRF1)